MLTADECYAALETYYQAKARSTGQAWALFGEVKVGPTVSAPAGRGPVRLDALAIAKSWVGPGVIGYEIKVSRGDFRGDDKWHRYLPYCNRFAFVCPEGVIKKEDLPEKVGLLYVSDNKTIRVVRRPLFHSESVDPKIYQFILYSRLENDKWGCPYHGRERRAEHFAARARAVAAGQRTDDMWCGDLVSRAARSKHEEDTAKAELAHLKKNLDWEMQMLRALVSRLDPRFRHGDEHYSRRGLPPEMIGAQLADNIKRVLSTTADEKIKFLKRTADDIAASVREFEEMCAAHARGEAEGARQAEG